MLWYKSWIETRWRFLIGLFILTCSAAGAVLTYPRVQELMEYVPTNLGGIIGDKIREAADLASTYRGFVWSNWFRQNLAQTGTLFAVLLGIASVFSPSRGALFTLSLPVSRRRLLGVRAATGLVELSVLAFLPSLLIPLLAPAIHQTYGVGDTLIHALCFFVGASLFFSSRAAAVDDLQRSVASVAHHARHRDLHRHLRTAVPRPGHRCVPRYERRAVVP